jgi:hypothetical protein
VLTRPASQFTELGTKVIEQGLADPKLSEFYEAIQSASHHATPSSLKPYINYLSLCSDKVSDMEPPPIFYVGLESSQRLLFGDQWATPQASCGPASGLRTPDPELEKASADAYKAALNLQPYYGYARTLISLNGETYEIAFERLIVGIRPAPTASYQICAYFGVIQDLQRRL